jgi:uncharacterized protein Usg
MKYIYKLHRDINQDIWNWWDACNAINFGMDWSKKVDIKIAKEIKGKKRQDAYLFLKQYLREKYKNDQAELTKNYRRIKKQLDLNFEPACDKLIKVMGKPLYRNDFNFYLTTFPSIPINKEKGFIWLEYDWANPINTFLHELCHMQFIHYWRENLDSPVSKLTKEQFEDLKESLTVILDKDFLPLISEEDPGYKIHEKFRKLLKDYWGGDKDFEKLVEYALLILNNENALFGK